MESEALGRIFKGGEIIIRQGDPGDCMFVVQEGKVEVIQESEAGSLLLDVLGEGDIFGEMAIFDRQPRSSTVRALGEARVLTVDKKGFLRRVHEDPSLAFRILQMMSLRIRRLDRELARCKAGGPG